MPAATSGDVIAALRARGLWTRMVRAGSSRRARRVAVEHQAGSRRRQAQRGRARHLAVREAGATERSVETYLASRGLHLPPPRRSASMPG